jgi:hypothetical protein
MGGTHAGGSGGNGSGGNGSGGNGSGGNGSGGTAGRDGGGCVCPAIFAPVCGVDGHTYGSACEAQCAGVAISHQGACVTSNDDASSPRGFCNTEADCVFQPIEGCCGACLATTDQPVPSGGCLGVDCAAPPGGCSCVNHQCARGVLTSGTSCSMQHDACGGGLKCCRPCAVPPTDGGDHCPPICVQGAFLNGKVICPLIP